MLIDDRSIDDASPALIEGSYCVSYSELRRRVGALIEKLPRQRGLAFCFCSVNLSTVVNYLACLQAGHPVALLDENLSGQLKERLIEHYQPNFTLASEEVTYLEAPEAELHPDLALLLSTSGTTGNPKFVRLSRRNLVANAESIRQALSITASERAMASLPFHYSYGLSVLNSHLGAGASLALCGGGILSQEFWNVCRTTECTSLAGVPHTYRALHRLGLGNLNVPQLRTLTQAGGKLPMELIAHFHSLMTERGGRFLVMYGQTEATARMAILRGEDLPAKLGSVGQVIPQGKFSIDNGEVIYHGPNVMMGYATSRSCLALGDQQCGTLRTGDTGHLDQDGYLYIDGRLGREVKIAGLRINLDDIEALFQSTGPTAALAERDKIQLFCAWEDPSGFTHTLNNLAQQLRLSHHAFEYHQVGELPLLGNGKVDYQTLARRV